MRNLLLLTLMSLFAMCDSRAQVKAQRPDYTSYNLTLPTKNNSIYYESVENIDSVSASDLFDRARIWAVDMFNSSKAVIEVADKKSGIIAGKGSIELLGNPYDLSIVTVRFTFNIQFKEGKYQEKFYDFEYATLNALNGQSVSGNFDDAYNHYNDGNINHRILESTKHAKERYAAYIYLFKNKMTELVSSLYAYESGEHKTNF